MQADGKYWILITYNICDNDAKGMGRVRLRANEPSKSQVYSPENAEGAYETSLADIPADLEGLNYNATMPAGKKSECPKMRRRGIAAIMFS